MRYLLGMQGSPQNPTPQQDPAAQSAFLNSMPQGMRQQFLAQNPGFGQTTQSPLGGINGPSPQGGFGGGMLGTGGFMQTGGGQGGMGPQVADPLGMGAGGGATSAPGQRVESIFGPTGIQSTPLQRQATGGISQFLNQPSPESRTLNALQPGLMQMAGQNLQTPDYLKNALGGQLAGGNPLNQQGQDLLSGMMGGANPLPGAAQNALGGHLNADILGGGLRDYLANATRSGGIGGLGGAQQGDMSAIQRELAFAPGQQVADALRPNFERNLDMANQAGGRFGSANAVLRSRAVDDYNLTLSNALQQDLARRANLASSLAANSTANASQANQYGLGAADLGQRGQFNAAGMLMQGNQGNAGIQQGAANLLGQFGQQGIQNQQNAAQLQGGFAQQGLQNQQGAANILGNLGLGYNQLSQQGQLGAGGLLGQLAGQAGQNDFNRLLGGYGVGAQQAQQNDVGNARNIGIIMQQLAAMQGATLGAPTTTTPNGFNQGANLGGTIGQLLALFGAGGS